MSLILGISAYYHDSSATLINDGNIVSAVQEERFSRIRHDERFPEHSIRYILSENKILLNDLEAVVFYEKPLVKFERLIETNLANVPFGFKSFKSSLPIWIKEKLFQNFVLDPTCDRLNKITNLVSGPAPPMRAKSSSRFCCRHFRT